MDDFVFCCAHSFRAYARITCFHCFCSNLVNCYRIKINFNVFWEPLENLKLWSHLYYAAMASFAVAGVFTYARIILLSLQAFEYLKVFYSLLGPDCS